MIRNKKGVALLWALITSTAILLIASIVANTIISESHMTVDIENSNKAYAAAKSGVEYAKWYIDQNCYVNPFCNSVPTLNITLKDSSGKDDSKASMNITKITNGFKIESTGTNITDSVSRKLLYTYATSGFTKVPNSSIITPPASSFGASGLRNSFSIMFDLWRDPAPVATIGKVGVSDGTGTSYIYIVLNMQQNQIAVEYKDNLGNAARTSTRHIDIPTDFIWTNFYASRIQLDYINDTAIQVTLNAVDPGTNVPACSERYSFDITGQKFNPFTKVAVSPTAPASQTFTEIAYPVVKIGTTSLFGYIDNFSYKGN